MYTTVEDTLFTVESVTDTLLDEVVDPSEYSVLYFDNAGKITNGTGAVASVGGDLGGVPNTVAKNYTVLIIKGDVTKDFNNATGSAVSPSAGSLLSNVKKWDYKTGGDIVYREFNFDITQKTTSVEGASAYEVQLNADKSAEDAKNFSDTSFNYTGAASTVAFTVGGKKLDGSNQSQYKVVWTEYAGDAAPAWGSGSIDGKSVAGYQITDAGKYVAKITGVGAYTGTETVEFTVEGIDLSSDTVSFAPRPASEGIDFGNYSSTNTGGTAGADGNFGVLKNSKLTVNGMEISDSAEMEAVLIAVDDQEVNGADYSGPVKTAGKYTFKVVANDDQDNVTGSCLVDAYLVNHEVTFKYAGGNVPASFDAQYGQTFNPDYFTADTLVINGQKVTPEFEVTVMKDGEVVTDYSEPGDYTYTVSAPFASYGGETYAGEATGSFTVVGKSYANATGFVFVDGEAVSSSKQVEYKAADYATSVVVKDEDGKTLAEGTDYTVTLTKDGEAVEAINGVGDYVLTVTGKDYAETEIAKVEIEVTKAEIESAEPTALFFATDGETAAIPSFVGSTNATFDKGVKFDLAAEDINVSYAKVDSFANEEDGYVLSNVDETTSVKASELTETGWYVATINVLTNVETIKGTGIQVLFKVAEQVVFSDVAADAWYAESVYTAAQSTPVKFEYMTGIAGTKLFMPEAQITRAEVAQVFANMAGQDKNTDGTEYPTKFSDVEASAWYAKAIAWASQAGIVGGYDGTDVFGTFDNATREQIATMIYRYAKAQGMDVAVEDEAAALAKYADGASVSEYAKTAMAYCVEQGVFGVDVDSLRPQDFMSRAEMAATSVRVQPDGAKKEL